MQTLALLALTMAVQAAADCCAYTVNKTRSQNSVLFANLLETDFLHPYSFNPSTAKSVGWLPQTYNQTNNSGPLGMAKMAENVVANPLASIWDWGGEGIAAGVDPGLQLWVKRDLLYGGDDEGLGYVPTAEIVSGMDDILYGSFRIAMKTTSVNGTCAAFFFYRDDTQEIDVEVLSAQQHQYSDPDIPRYPVNFVVQNTTLPLASTGSSPRSSNTAFQMPQPPTGDAGSPYHEYRFDWLPDRIDFYVDSEWAYTVTDNVPSSPGAVHFSHWSNGNPGWTYGPPSGDAVMTVAYIKAYFNTTSSVLQRNCDDSTLCKIPDQQSPVWSGGPAGNETGRSFFFSRAEMIERNMTDEHGDQNVHDPREGSASTVSVTRREALFRLVVVVCLSLVVSALLGHSFL